MENRKRKIYWQEDIQSYLPRFDSLFVENFFRTEIMLYIDGIKTGKILSNEEYDTRFRYKIGPDEKGRMENKLRPEANEYTRDIVILHQVNSRLCEIFGVWVSDFSVYSILHFHFKPSKNQLLFINELRLDETVKILHNSLKKHFDEKTGLIKKLNTDPPPSNLNSLQDFIFYAANKVLRIEMEESQYFDDRWFGWVSYYTTLYLESLGFTADEDLIYDIVDKHFRSDCQPEEEEIIRYLDEIKGIEAQKIFDEKYGKS